MFRTEDGGAGWQKMDDGPPASVADLAHSTLEGSMNTGWLYAAAAGALYLSEDGAKSWRALPGTGGGARK